MDPENIQVRTADHSGESIHVKEKGKKERKRFKNEKQNRKKSHNRIYSLLTQDSNVYHVYLSVHVPVVILIVSW